MSGAVRTTTEVAQAPCIGELVIRALLGLMLIAAAALTACGGGGGSGPPPPPPGKSTLSLFAGAPNGPGSMDGTGAAASFYQPAGVATDTAGNVYIADSYNNVIRKITAAGVVTTFAGTAGVTGNADGQGAAASFNFPVALAIDSAGNLFVADTLNDTIRKITPAAVVTTFASTPGPQGVAVDSAGNVYVAGLEVILKITPDGVVTTFAGLYAVFGSADGTGPDARFSTPEGLAIDSAGNLFVADSENYTIRKITPAAVVTTFAGTAAMEGSTDGTGPDARFSDPQGAALDGAGNLYVSDFNGIRKITAAGVVTTVAGIVAEPGSADGTAAAARFYQPTGVATDSAGNVYVADTWNEIVRKMSAAGVVTTLAGLVGAWGSADGTAAEARFDGPGGIAADNAGNLYVADQGNNTIRRITPAGVTTTVAGMAGLKGSADGTGTAARFAGPVGVALDGADNLYVADTGNCVVRKVTTQGVVTTLAGTAGMCGSNDGTGAAASFFFPQGVALDSAGNVFVADDNFTVRKITPNGVVTTFAGTAGKHGTSDGTGAAASFVGPTGVAVDAAGRVYVTDNGSTGENVPPVHLIRMITPVGVVTTLSTINSQGIGLRGLGVDADGNVYVADTGRNVIVELTPAGVVTEIVGRSGEYGFQPGPLPGILSGPTAVSLFGRTLYTTTNNAIVQVSDLP